MYFLKNYLKKHFNISIEDEDILEIFPLHISSVNYLENSSNKMIISKNMTFIGSKLFKLICMDYVFMNVTRNQTMINGIVSSMTKKAERLFLNRYRALMDYAQDKSGKNSKGISYEFLLYNLICVQYLTCGYSKAYKCVENILSRAYDEKKPIDAKSKLQEWSQTFNVRPVYTLVSETGDKHKEFCVRVDVKSRSATGLGRQKKDAEKNAALKFLIENNILDLSENKQTKSRFYMPKKKSKIVSTEFISNFKNVNFLFDEALTTPAYAYENSLKYSRKNYITIGVELISISALDKYVKTLDDLSCPHDFPYIINTALAEITLFCMSNCLDLYNNIKQSNGDQNADPISMQTETLKALFSAIFITEKFYGREINKISDLMPKKLDEVFTSKVLVDKNNIDDKTELIDYAMLLNDISGVGWKTVFRFINTDKGIKTECDIISGNNKQTFINYNRFPNKQEARSEMAKFMVRKFIKLLDEDSDNFIKADLARRVYSGGKTKTRLRIFDVIFDGSVDRIIKCVDSFNEMFDTISFLANNNVAIPNECLEKLIEKSHSSDDFFALDVFLKKHPKLLNKQINDKFFEALAKI